MYFAKRFCVIFIVDAYKNKRCNHSKEQGNLFILKTI